MDAYDMEPTPAALAAIEAEWPLIEAELGVLDAEIAAITAPGGPSPLDWRRVRRARRQLLATIGHRPPAAPSPLIGSVPRMGKSFAFRGALTDEHDHRDGAA